MSKRDLAASLKKLTNKPEIPQPGATSPSGGPEVTEIKPKNPHHRPSREGTKAISGHFAPEISKQLRILAVNQDTSVQVLLGEALNLLFESYGLPKIAPERDGNGKKH